MGNGFNLRERKIKPSKALHNRGRLILWGRRNLEDPDLARLRVIENKIGKGAANINA
jgi:hypothetical protein